MLEMELVVSLTKILFFVCVIPSLKGQCTEPTKPANGYTLTTSKASYSNGEIYEIFCTPGYTLVGSSNLTCTGTAWSPSAPTCDKAVTLSWWVYLAGAVAAIILIPCCFPRIIACICKKKDKSDDVKPLVKGQGSYHGKGGEPKGFRRHHKPITPITDSGKHKLKNIQDDDDDYNDYYGHYGKNGYY